MPATVEQRPETETAITPTAMRTIMDERVWDGNVLSGEQGRPWVDYQGALAALTQLMGGDRVRDTSHEGWSGGPYDAGSPAWDWQFTVDKSALAELRARLPQEQEAVYGQAVNLAVREFVTERGEFKISNVDGHAYKRLSEGGRFTDDMIEALKTECKQLGTRSKINLEVKTMEGEGRVVSIPLEVFVKLRNAVLKQKQ